MKFFMPAASSPENGEAIYQAIRKFTIEQMGALREERYFAIHYTHNGKALAAEVGKIDPLERETVLTIFRALHEDGAFYVCTMNRGANRGHPILADGGPGTHATPFDK